MRRYNQRRYRVARAILRNDAESEDVMRDAYVRAYEHLAQFAGRALKGTPPPNLAVLGAMTFSLWLTFVWAWWADRHRAIA